MSSDLVKTLRHSDAELREHFLIVAEWLRSMNADKSNFDSLLPAAQEMFGCSEACVIRIGKILGIEL